jgi:hypothetical protein
MSFKNAHRCTQNAENGFGFDFLGQYHKYGNDFLSHIIWVTSDKTWFLFVIIETKE